MRALLLAGAACLILPGPARAAAPSREAQKTLAAAAASYGKADFENALRRFNKALALCDGWKTAAGYRAMCRWTMGDRAGAEEDARLAVRLKPNSAESFLARGKARFVLKDYAGAAEDFEDALRQDRDAAEAHFGLGSVYSAKGELARAVKSLDQAVRIDSEFAAAMLVRGSVRERLKDFARAIKDFDRVLEINPRFDWARFYRGRCLREVKEYRRAVDDFDEFLSAHPDFEDAMYLRSNVRFLLGDYSGSESDLTRVIELNPKRGLAYSNRGQARAQQGDREGALSDLRKALELEPGKRDKIQAAIDRLQEEPARTPAAARAPSSGYRPNLAEPPDELDTVRPVEASPTVGIEARPIRPRPKAGPALDDELPEPLAPRAGTAAPARTPPGQEPPHRQSGRDEAVLIE